MTTGRSVRRPASAASRTWRILTVVTLALSWLMAAGGPATAEVTGWRVERPREGATLDREQPLEVYVDRTASADDERVEVRTRLLDAQGRPVSDKVVALDLVDRRDTGAGTDQLTFAGVIDPYDLVWLPEGGTAANGRYTLQLQLLVSQGEWEREPGDWHDHAFLIDAEPPPPGQPTVEVKDAAAKRMRIEWAPSSAPDIGHYTVERRLDGGPWTVAQDYVDPAETAITDTVGDYGSYRYRVTAVRWAPDGSDTERTATSDYSSTVELERPEQPADRGRQTDDSEDSDGSVEGRNSGPSTDLRPSSTSSDRRTGSSAPAGANQTYEGPLDYGVEQQEVTERVPVDIAQGGTSTDGSTLQVLNRSIDRERYLPAVAGGLILVLSAAHVLRFLNE